MSGAMKAAAGHSISGSMRTGKHISLCLLAWSVVALRALPLGAADLPPQRVVSINLCTDQLAMMLAAEGQLLSVSDVAKDVRVSPMADRAGQYVINHGNAEEIYTLRPDLVLAGVYTPRATVAMLEQLSIPVAVFDTVDSLDAVRDRVLEMGAVLHREDAARALVSDYDARLAGLRAESAAARPSAMLYYANGYTSGDQSLAGEILNVAGFDNAAVAAGYDWGRKMPLEVLALTDPDLVITTRPYPGGSRAEAVMDHPVVHALRDGRATATVTDHDWICGTPLVLNAIERLAETRRSMTNPETGAAQ